MGAVGAAAPTDFGNGAFAPTLFIKNSISLLIKLTRELRNQKFAPTDLKILTRALLDEYQVYAHADFFPNELQIFNQWLEGLQRGRFYVKIFAQFL